jgi:cytochrome c553
MNGRSFYPPACREPPVGARDTYEETLMVATGPQQTLSQLDLQQPVGCIPMKQTATATLLGSIVLLTSAATASAASSAYLEQLARHALQLQADSTRGQALYSSNCSSCHGSDAHGDVTRLIPSLAGQRRAYLIKHLAEFNDRDRQAAQMHPLIALGGLKTPQAWLDLASYLRDRVPLPATGAHNRELTARGARSYQRWCSACHGKDASGDDAEFVPSLRHQHHAYLLKELQTLSAQHRFNVAPDAMSMLDSLSPAALAGIADHVAALNRPAPKPRAASISAAD